MQRTKEFFGKEVKNKMGEWTDKQKKAFIEIQNRIYNEMGLTNLEVAEMHTIKDRNEVFALFQFNTSRWLNEFAEKERQRKRRVKNGNL